MDFRDTSLCRIRTVTVFLSLNKNREEWGKAIEKASQFCLRLAEEFKRKNYTVQSIRIVTNPFGEYLDTSSREGA
ncbi:MAG: DUF711 family protein, partial [Spirochaetales bacterium]|nr:DUF711 family protein [Spirochaetales bacterium]